MWNVIRWLHRKIVPKSLSQEVLEVFAASPNIQKLGHNKEEDYKFLEILTMCQEFKGEVFARGILLIANDIDCSFEQISEPDGSFTMRCTVRTKFEATRECWFGTQRIYLGEALGTGCDSYEMIALQTAQTIAFKAMLKRSSMTYGVLDDPERSKDKDKLNPREQVRLVAYQRRAWKDKVKESGLTPEKISAELSELMGFPIDSEQIPDLPNDAFEKCMEYLSKHGDLSELWGKGLEVLKARKAQPVVSILDAQREIGAD